MCSFSEVTQSDSNVHKIQHQSYYLETFSYTVCRTSRSHDIIMIRWNLQKKKTMFNSVFYWPYISLTAQISISVSLKSVQLSTIYRKVIIISACENNVLVMHLIHEKKFWPLCLFWWEDHNIYMSDRTISEQSVFLCRKIFILYSTYCLRIYICLFSKLYSSFSCRWYTVKHLEHFVYRLPYM